MSKYKNTEEQNIKKEQDDEFMFFLCEMFEGLTPAVNMDKDKKKEDLKENEIQEC